MTSSNINKIVRSNINLKPWILSKNTSEIVNTCIQKIYKQSQNNFKNDLLQTKLATPKPENKGPIRSLKSQERVRNAPISINVSRTAKNRVPGLTGCTEAGIGATAPAATGVGERLVTRVINNSKKSPVANLAANKKLLRSSPNYKIYGSRRFGSSASSSNASIFRRNDDRRRSHQTAQLNYLLRSFGTQPVNRSMTNSYGLNPGVAKYIVPARNQHMASRTGAVPPHVTQISTAIQRDLMIIDGRLKDRIALGRNKLMKLAPHLKEGYDPMDGWHHPPPPEIFMSRFNERGIASVELQEQYRRIKIANKMRQFEHLRQMEKRSDLLGGVSKKDNRERVLNSYVSDPKDSMVARASPHTAMLMQQPQVHERLPLPTRRFGIRGKVLNEAPQAENLTGSILAPTSGAAPILGPGQPATTPTALASATAAAGGMPIIGTIGVNGNVTAASLHKATTATASRKSSTKMLSATSLKASGGAHGTTSHSGTQRAVRYNRSSYYKKL